MGVSLSSFFSVNGFEWSGSSATMPWRCMAQRWDSGSGPKVEESHNSHKPALSLVTSYSSSVAAGQNLFIPITHWSLKEATKYRHNTC